MTMPNDYAKCDYRPGEELTMFHVINVKNIARNIHHNTYGPDISVQCEQDTRAGYIIGRPAKKQRLHEKEEDCLIFLDGSTVFLFVQNFSSFFWRYFFPQSGHAASPDRQAGSSFFFFSPLCAERGRVATGWRCRRDPFFIRGRLLSVAIATSGSNVVEGMPMEMHRFFTCLEEVLLSKSLFLEGSAGENGKRATMSARLTEVALKTTQSGLETLCPMSQSFLNPDEVTYRELLR